MFKKIVVGLVVVIGVFLVIVSRQPTAFRITRSAALAAPAPALFAQVNDFHKWEAWSPWAKMDPNAKNTIEGPASGVGAKFSWDGNRNVGAGRMTIIESHPTDLIRLKLEFLKPFKAINDTEFTFKPEGKKTIVTWTMAGDNNFVGKAMGVFINCDKMIGGQFEQGLKNLEAAAAKR